MWSWFTCYMSGRHDYGMWCESGAMFLRCVNCGKRSAGWAVDAKTYTATPRGVITKPLAAVAARSSAAAS